MDAGLWLVRACREREASKCFDAAAILAMRARWSTTEPGTGPRNTADDDSSNPSIRSAASASASVLRRAGLPSWVGDRLVDATQKESESETETESGSGLGAAASRLLLAAIEVFGGSRGDVDSDSDL